MLEHEADVRAWLRRSSFNGIDADDIVQETYCRLSMLKEVDSIHNPRAYFFTVARSIVLEAMRRSRVVRIDALADLSTLDIADPSPSVERIVSGRQDVARLQTLIAALPQRCAQIFTLRKVHGLSQREVAQKLNLSENVIEKQTARGLRLLLQAITDANEDRREAPKPQDDDRRSLRQH
ncbi:RNA polymerase sigma factor [Sphingomonas oleivorans]|uniref:RNA polymerase sigma factor n=1 Tax=Sphingomonas oleivorans TaxID=1735121 RepID=UPI0013FE096B|nr:sigma-70 family RNA polymerase sigma factor [Sphingomonas oleivorans]